MALQHSSADLQTFVKSVGEFSSCFSNSTSMGWNSQVMEFKPFVRPFPHSEEAENFYFKLFHASSDMKYVKEKYQKLFKDFQGLFVNVEVQMVSQKMHDCVYLIRGTQNYFSLERLIQKEERKILSISFILGLLEFFDQILRVNQQMKLSIDLRASTILQKDGIFKLADYKLLFHPNNLKSKDPNRETILINQMKYVIFDVLSLRNRQSRQKFQQASRSLVQQLRDRRSESTDRFVEVIEKFFNDGVIMSEEISSLKSRPGSVLDEHGLLDSVLTSSDISIPLLQREDSNLTQTSIAVVKPRLNRKRLWRIMFFVLVLAILAALGISYYFLTRDIDCGKFHYQQNRKCYSCPDSCDSCVGGGQYNCTYCATSYWLIVKDPSDTVGKCSAECKGFKDSSTMHCISAQR